MKIIVCMSGDVGYVYNIIVSIVLMYMNKVVCIHVFFFRGTVVESLNLEDSRLRGVH